MAQKAYDSKKTASVAVVGATGLAGQQFISALSNHQQLAVTQVAASHRSAGKTYQEAITSAGWSNGGGMQDGPLDPKVAELVVQDGESLDTDSVDLVFSCVESDAAKRLEPLYAKKLPCDFNGFGVSL